MSKRPSIFALLIKNRRNIWPAIMVGVAWSKAVGYGDRRDYAAGISFLQSVSHKVPGPSVQSKFALLEGLYLCLLHRRKESLVKYREALALMEKFVLSSDSSRRGYRPHEDGYLFHYCCAMIEHLGQSEKGEAVLQAVVWPPDYDVDRVPGATKKTFIFPKSVRGHGLEEYVRIRDKQKRGG
jgi:hypothetical protein